MKAIAVRVELEPLSYKINYLVILSLLRFNLLLLLY